MATKIDIISGFLGAGKTTLIKKLLKEAYADEQVVLIEPISVNAFSLLYKEALLIPILLQMNGIPNCSLSRCSVII